MMGTAPFAALRMYDLPEIVPAVNALGAAILSRLPGAPQRLTWDGDHRAQWLDPNLLLGQSCGWPLVNDLRDRVHVVGAFVHRGLETCDDGARYRSVLVARAAHPLASFVGSRAAINSYESLSGWISLAATVAPFSNDLPFFGKLVLTASHVASLAAVRDGAADLAAIDGVTFALLRHHRPGALDGVHVVGSGPSIPTLPLITAFDAEVVRAAVGDAITDPSIADARTALHIERFEPLGLEHYADVAELAAQVADNISVTTSSLRLLGAY